MKKIIISVLCLGLIFGACGCGAPDSDAEAKLETGLAGAIALTDSYIENCVKTMEILAVTDEVLSGDWEEMLPVMTKAEEVMIPGPKWYGLPDGSYYVVGMGKTDKNISDRAYYPVIMSGQATYSELVISKATGEKALVTAVPVIDKGEVTGFVGVSVFLEDLSEIIAEDLDLPDDMVFYAVGPGDRVALHSNTDLIFEVNPEPPGEYVSGTAPFTGWRIVLGYRG